jgi:hypothetical protein
MKKFSLIIFLLIANFATAQFDLKNPTAISLNGGFFLPYSSETFKTGVNIGIDIQHKINPVYLFFNLAYNVSARKKIEPSQSYNNTSGSGILEISSGARILIAESNLNYFIDAGLGLYVEKKGAYEMSVNGKLTSFPSENNATLGGNFGVVAEYPLNKDFDFVARAKYHLYFGVGNSPFLNTYFGVMGGIKYNIKF